MSSSSTLQFAFGDEETISYHVIPDSEITQGHLDACAELCFISSAYYGETADEVYGDLRERYLPSNTSNHLIVAVTNKGQQIGQCIASKWEHTPSPCTTDSHPQPTHWITHLVTHPRFTSQRIATTLLQHYLVAAQGRKSYMGMLTSHPYALLSLIRVFGTGIESLPFRQLPHLTEPSSLPRPHGLLSPRIHAEILFCSPLPHLRATVVSSTDTSIDIGKGGGGGGEEGLRVRTGRRLDGIRKKETDTALERVVWAVNRQVQKPWLWPFGLLSAGEEWACVLELDMMDKKGVSLSILQRKGEKKPPPPLPPLTTTKPTAAAAVAVAVMGRVDYKTLATYIHSHPSALVVPVERSLGDASADISRLLSRAKSQTIPDLTMTMAAYSFPRALHNLYSTLVLPHDLALSSHETTWRHLRGWAKETGDRNRILEVDVLQAVHFYDMVGRLSLDIGEEERGEKEEGRGKGEDAGPSGSRKRALERSDSPSLFFSENEDSYSDSGSTGYHPGIRLSRLPRSRLPLRAGSTLRRGKIFRPP